MDNMNNMPNSGGDASPKMPGGGNFDPSSMGGSQGMNPMMMQQMMMQQGGGGMPNQDMMGMMGGGYCGTAGGMAGGMGSQGMTNPEMEAMLRANKRGADDLEGSPSAKRANLGDAAPQDDDDKASDDKEKASDEGANSPVPRKEHVPTPPSKEGIKFYSRNDVLCGRGGGTNVHPGNRRFRDLINANRRAYLKARKNDKPAISRSIVRTIREMNGRFLKKDEKLGLWFEIGDDGAREKTSQALRQRAPEMRKILFEDEQRQQQVQQQEMMMQRQQQMMMGGGGQGGMGGMSGMSGMSGMGGMQGMGGMGMGGRGMQSMEGLSQQEQSLMAKYNMMQHQKLMQQEREFMMRRAAMMQQMGGGGMPGMGMGGGMPGGAGMDRGMGGAEGAGGDSLQGMSANSLLAGGMKPVMPRGA